MGLRVSTVRVSLPATGRRLRHLVLLALLALVSLGGAGCAQPLSPEGVSTMDLNNVAGKTIFFGHQSVGWNIIAGIEDLLKEQPDATLTIVKAEDVDGAQGPALIHAEVGQNYDPMSKLQAFDRFIRDGMGERADIAFFKFCYVDFDKNTDVDQLFAAYKQTMADLSSAYPETTFVYVTTPLMAPDPGIKGLLKGLLGRNEEVLANTKRQQFNELMRAEYAGKAALFDLAAAEATYPDGRACTISANGQSAPCLIGEYTYDGGHLNETGRQIVAGQLVKFLATLE